MTIPILRNSFFQIFSGVGIIVLNALPNHLDSCERLVLCDLAMYRSLLALCIFNETPKVEICSWNHVYFGGAACASFSFTFSAYVRLGLLCKVSIPSGSIFFLCKVRVTM